MIDAKKMEVDFIEKRKKYNEELRLNQKGFYTRIYYYPELDKKIEKCSPFRLKEEELNKEPNLLTIEYKNGKGVMIIDQDALNKLPKSIQLKIFNLGKVI